MNDEALAWAIRNDRIDILIDQTGHMARSRLGVFARKPAPLQILYPGYPNTTGMPAVDYCITDADRDPTGAEKFYTEQLMRVAGTSQCFRPAEGDPEVGAAAFVANGYITFGSLGKPSKITPGILNLWTRILQKMPDARLVLMDPTDGSFAQEILATFLEHGVVKERVEFVSRLPRRQYMEIYNRIDIVLDTFPYNGHTTTFDALWMGVPVLTLAGATHVAREGLAILETLGLSNLVCRSEEQYVAAAINLSRDTTSLGALRAQLRSLIKASAFTDYSRLARKMEDAYRDAWRQWCRRQGAAS